MESLLNQRDSYQLAEEARETISIETAFAIVKGTGATFGVDGDQFFYGFGSLPEKDSIFGFGKTPRGALNNFANAYYSTQIKPQ